MHSNNCTETLGACPSIATPAPQYLAGLRERAEQRGAPVPKRVGRIEREVEALMARVRRGGAACALYLAVLLAVKSSAALVALFAANAAVYCAALCWFCAGGG